MDAWAHGEVSIFVRCTAHKVSVLDVCEAAVRLQFGCTLCCEVPVMWMHWCLRYHRLGRGCRFSQRIG